MDLTVALIGLALHILIWEKLPEWGTWFNTLLAALPSPLRTLFEQWQCPYCAGFWIALVLHGLTGLWTLPALQTISTQGLPGAGPLADMGLLGQGVAWFLDALVTGLLMACGKMTLKAIQFPALMTMARGRELMADIARQKARPTS